MVFGVDPPALDEPLVPHSGTFDRKYIVDSAAGPVALDVPFRDGEFVVRLFQRGVELPIEWDAANSTFTFDGIAGELYRIVFQDPSGPRSEIQATTPSVQLRQLFFERPDAPLPDPGVKTTIGGIITNPQAGYHRFITTGTWSDTSFLTTPIDATTASYEIDWSPNRRMISTSQHDRVFLIAEADRGSYFAIERHDTAALDMQSGANELNSTLVEEMLPPQCTTLRAPFAELDSRLAAAYPDFATTSTQWGIYGSPVPEISPGGLLFLADSITSAGADVQFVDPYGMPRIAQAIALRYTMGSTGASTQVLLATAYRVYTPVNSGPCPETGATPIPAEALAPPSQLRLAAQPIDVVDATVSIAGTTEIEVTWEGAGAHSYAVALYDVTDLDVYPTAIRTYRAGQSRVLVESALLLAGRRYVLSVQAIRGLRDAANGNFADIEYPFTVAVGTSRVFAVTR